MKRSTVVRRFDRLPRMGVPSANVTACCGSRQAPGAAQDCVMCTPTCSESDRSGVVSAGIPHRDLSLTAAPLASGRFFSVVLGVVRAGMSILWRSVGAAASDAYRLVQRDGNAARCERWAFTRVLPDTRFATGEAGRWRRHRGCRHGPTGRASTSRRGAGSYSFFDAVDAASPCVAAVAGSSVAIVFSVNFSYSQSMRMLSMPAIPPSAYDADTLK